LEAYDVREQLVELRRELAEAWGGLSTSGVSSFGGEEDEDRLLLANEIRLLGVAPERIWLHNFAGLLGVHDPVHYPHSYLLVDEFQSLAPLIGTGTNGFFGRGPRSVAGLATLFSIIPRMTQSMRAVNNFEGKNIPGFQQALDRGPDRLELVTKAANVYNGGVLVIKGGPTPEIIFTHREHSFGDVANPNEVRQALEKLLDRCMGERKAEKSEQDATSRKAEDIPSEDDIPNRIKKERLSESSEDEKGFVFLSDANNEQQRNRSQEKSTGFQRTFSSSPDGKNTRTPGAVKRSISLFSSESSSTKIGLRDKKPTRTVSVFSESMQSVRDLLS